MISGFGPAEFETVDACRRAIEKFQTAAELVKEFGMIFGIHNHWWEFVTLNGKYAFDMIMDERPTSSANSMYIGVLLERLIP